MTYQSSKCCRKCGHLPAPAELAAYLNGCEDCWADAQPRTPRRRDHARDQIPDRAYRDREVPELVDAAPVPAGSAPLSLWG